MFSASTVASASSASVAAAAPMDDSQFERRSRWIRRRVPPRNGRGGDVGDAGAGMAEAGDAIRPLGRSLSVLGSNERAGGPVFTVVGPALA
jgi:hypothetical protein